MYPPTDAVYFPLYTKCCELDLALCMNTGIPGPPLPAEPQNPIHLDRVCYRFPELKLCMIHGADPWWDTAIRLMLKYRNLRLMTSAWSPKRLPASLLHYMSTRGKDRILFASDYPVLSFERCLGEVGEPRPRRRGQAGLAVRQRERRSSSASRRRNDRRAGSRARRARRADRCAPSTRTSWGSCSSIVASSTSGQCASSDATRPGSSSSSPGTRSIRSPSSSHGSGREDGGTRRSMSSNSTTSTSSPLQPGPRTDEYSSRRSSHRDGARTALIADPEGNAWELLADAVRRTRS